MSAYIVEKEKIDVIVSYIRLMYRHGNTPSLEELEKRGQALMDMNREEVNQRYSENEKPEVYVFQNRPTSLSLCIRAMRELRYQCSEGDVPGSAQFKELNTTLTPLLAAFFDNEMQRQGVEGW